MTDEKHTDPVETQNDDCATVASGSRLTASQRRALPANDSRSQSPESSNPEPPKVQPTTSEKPTKRQKFWAFAFASTGFLIVYLLSAGPMAAIHNASKFGPFQRALGIVYAPVIFVVKNGIEPFASLMKAYIEIFR